MIHLNINFQNIFPFGKFFAVKFRLERFLCYFLWTVQYSQVYENAADTILFIDASVKNREE